MAKVEPIPDSSLRFISGPEFVAGFVAPEYVVDGILQRGYLYAMTGQTGHGKTAEGIFLSRCVEQGQPFAGHDVEKGNALILAGENPDDIRARLILSEAVHGWPITDRLMVIPSTFSIENDIDLIAAEAEKVGGLSLVLVDTLAAYFTGDDENSNTELGNFARVLRKLTTVPGHPTVIVNCHPTKNATKDNLVPRGGGAFLAEIDGNLTLWSEDRASLQIGHHRKFRGPGFEPIDLKLETRTCKTLIDRKGRPIPSVVALPMTEEEAASLAQAARSDEDSVLDMLLNYPNGSYAAWCKTLGWMGATGLPLKSRVNRAMTSLEKAQLVENGRNGWTLTKKGKSEAQRVVEIGAAKVAAL